MRLISKHLKKLFSSNIYTFWQGISSKQFHSLKILKQNIEKEHSYVRKNNEEIGQQLISNIQNCKWSFVKKMLVIININQLQSWFLMRKIAKAINNSCNKLSLQSMNKEEILDLLSCLVLLRFQPKRLKADSFKGRTTQFDDSTSLVNELESHIKQLSINKDQTYFFELSRKLLHSNSLLLLSKREQLQKKLLNRIQTFMQNKSLLNDLLVRGCISNYWTKQFKNQLLSRKIPGNYLKAIHFEDIQIPTKIEKASQQYKIKTQSEIMNILDGFGYIVEGNMLVNGYEVDFLINNKIVVQYNGQHHYIINSKKLFPTAKHRWKQSILRRRNFIISSIPFSEWRTLKLFEEKRKYLVTKIQNDWLIQYKKSIQASK